MAAPMRLFTRASVACLSYYSASLSSRLPILNTKIPSARYYSGKTLSVANDERDIERLFIRDDVQRILQQITGFDIEKIFRARPMQHLKPPEYKLVTDAELAKMRREAESRARLFLQMPPVLNAWRQRSDEEGRILSHDEVIANFEPGDSKYVFIDISNHVPHRRRAVVVRENNGTLRVADPRERDRIINVYFPTEGRSHTMPKMFEEERLEKVLAEHRYEYVLDGACIQFEPDDPEYIRVTQRTYEHVASRNRFDDLRSTRHFGPMAFYLARHKNIDSLLADMIHRDFLTDGVELIRLYSILHPGCATATSLNRASIDSEDLIMIFAKNDAKQGSVIELALQSYQLSHSKHESSAAS